MVNKSWIRYGLLVLGGALPFFAKAQSSLKDADAMAKRFAPLVKFSKGEKYFPSSMNWLIERSALKDGSGKVIIPFGQIKPDDLRKHRGRRFFRDAEGKEQSELLGYHLDPEGNEETYRGQPLKNNEVVAPCYIN